MSQLLGICHYNAALEFIFDSATPAVEEANDFLNLTVSLMGDPGDFTVLLNISTSDTSSTALGSYACRDS